MDDSRLLQELNLSARQPQGATSVIQAITGEGLAQGPYMAARGGVEPTSFRTEGTNNLHLTSHALAWSRATKTSQSLPLGLIGRLDRVLRSAARLIGHIPKYASVSAYMRDVLHWLPVSQRILYRISALVWRSVTGCAPSYLTDLCRPVSDLASRRAL